MLQAAGAPLRRQLLQRSSSNLLPVLRRAPAAGFAKKRQDAEDDSGGSGGGRDTMQKLLKILESKPEAQMPRLSPEDDALWKAATKEYSRLKMAAHRAWQGDLSIKLELKKAALAALPEELRGAAAATQTELVPLNRHMFTATPPIPGFRERQQGGRRRRT